MNKLGLHIQQFTAEVKDIIATWQPEVIVWLDPNPEGVAAIRSVSPNTFIIGRKYESELFPLSITSLTGNRARRFNWAISSTNLLTIMRWKSAETVVTMDSISKASVSPEWWADECAAMAQVDAWIPWNEPFGHDATDLFTAFDDWQVRFRNQMLTHGMEAVSFNFGTGNFTKDGPDIKTCFPQTCAQFKYFGIHEYDWIIDPNLRPIDANRLGYYWNRWPYWLQSIGRGDITLFVTECGMTQAVHQGRPDQGWRSGADGMSDQDYIDWASWYNSQLVQDEQIGGAALFNFGGYGWPTFEHVGWARLDEIIELDAEQPPEEPNGGNDMAVFVYDFDHGPNADGLPDTGVQNMGLGWLTNVFGNGLKVHPITEQISPKPGDHYHKVVYLDARVGDSNCIINVRDINGSPMYQETVIFWWQTAGAHGLPAKNSNWTDNGAAGDTNPNGDVGPGMGEGAYYDKNNPDPNGGPHKVWVYDLPAEMVSGVGMLPGGDPLEDGSNKGPHAHVNIGYKEAIWQEEEEPEPPPPPSDIGEELNTIATTMQEDAARLKEIASLVQSVPNKVTLEFEDGSTQTYTLP